MENNLHIQEKLIKNFLSRNYQFKKIKGKKERKWKRVVVCSDGQTFYLRESKDKLKLHLSDILGEVFCYDEEITERVLNNFL